MFCSLYSSTANTFVVRHFYNLRARASDQIRAASDNPVVAKATSLQV